MVDAKMAKRGSDAKNLAVSKDKNKNVKKSPSKEQQVQFNTAASNTSSFIRVRNQYYDIDIVSTKD